MTDKIKQFIEIHMVSITVVAIAMLLVAWSIWVELGG